MSYKIIVVSILLAIFLVQDTNGFYRREPLPEVDCYCIPFWECQTQFNIAVDCLVDNWACCTYQFKPLKAPSKPLKVPSSQRRPLLLNK